MTAFSVGIDLGTTNTVVAYLSLGEEANRPRVLPLAQLVSANAVEPKDALPSFIYLGTTGEAGLDLPWSSGERVAVGTFAKRRAVETPARVVASAKSWLSTSTADPEKPALPAHAPDDVERVSAVDASRRILEHVRDAWNHHFHAEPGDALAIDQHEIVLTVPASFDARARELTVRAAHEAGLRSLTLLEEPEAAVYAWVARHENAFRELLAPGDVVLVVDVGGGTTDFSTIRAVDEGGELRLERVCVGEHVLLGGDNMDLALAHLAKQKLGERGKSLDRLALAALTHAARAAKEELLSGPSSSQADPEKEVPIAIAARGSKLIGSTLRTAIRRQEVTSTILDGFFAPVPLDATPTKRVRSGLAQLGLDYASDPIVTRHLAAFLRVHSERMTSAGAPETSALPTHVLFNGGVLKATLVRQRIVDVCEAWSNALGQEGPLELGGADYDHGVAIGAAVFGRNRRHGGFRVRGGTSHAYYVGIEETGPAIPGVEPELAALCIAPIGMEEGASARIHDHELALVVGEPVLLRFFSSNARGQDVVGTSLDGDALASLTELAPIGLTLTSPERAPGEIVPVRLETTATEIGTIAIVAKPLAPRTAGESFKVELSIRSSS